MLPTPVRAGTASTPETSAHTGVQRRIESRQAYRKATALCEQVEHRAGNPPADAIDPQSLAQAQDDAAYAAHSGDGHMVVYLTRGESTACPHAAGRRCTWIAPTVGAMIGEATVAADDPVLRPPLTGPLLAVLAPA